MRLDKLLSELNRRKYLILIVFLLVLCTLIWSFVLSQREGKLRVKFYDVGQGDSIFISTPAGYKILVDGGPNNKVLDYLNSDLGIGNREIDLVILTHPQSDHFFGLIETLKRYKVKKFLTTGAENSTNQYKLFADTLKNQNVKAEFVYQGESVTLTDNVTLSFIWPKEEKPTVVDLNDASVVIKLTYGNFDLLLTGDGDERIQPYSTSIGDIEVLKVPHHGSKTALRSEFLSSLKPEISVISSGRNNHYGHPAEPLLEQLRKVNSKILRTDQNGTVEIVSDGERWYTSSSR